MRRMLPSGPVAEARRGALVEIESTGVASLIKSWEG